MASKSSREEDSSGEDDGTELSSEKGGYECEIVKPPAKDFQSDCPVCLLVLREPHQVSCCGKAFCAECIGRLRKAKKRCPTCNATNFTSKLDKSLKTSLSYVRVHCCNQKSGCDWVGTLGDLETHLNLSTSSSEYKTQGCRFSGIACVYCSKQYQRYCISEHQSHDCPKRPYTCSTCQCRGSYDTITTTHWFDCQKRALDLKLKALEQGKSSRCSPWFLAIVTAVCAMTIAGLLSRYNETLGEGSSMPSTGEEADQLMEKRLQALQYSLAQNRKEIADHMASMKAELGSNRDQYHEYTVQLDDALAKVKSELEHTIKLLQQELESANNKLQQCAATATSLESRLQQSVTEFDRKLDSERKEREKAHNDVMAIIGKMKDDHDHHHRGCRGKGKHMHGRR